MTDLTSNTKAKNFFIVDRSQLENRFDAQFYRFSYDYTGFFRLSKIAYVKGGKRIPLGLSYDSNETPYLYLRVADINKDDEVNFSSLNYISEDVFNILSRYEILENDLAISIAGTIGKIILLKNIPQGKRIILTENCAKILLKSDAEILPDYLQLILQTSIIQRQIELNFIQTTIPKLGLDRINNLRLPPLPSITIQKNIIKKYYFAFNQKQQKETQAKELLASIDTYILQELGITLPEKTIGIKSRIFTTSFSELTGVRFDPLYFKNKGAIKSSIYTNNSLKKIAVLYKGQSITKEKITQGSFPVIAGGQSSPYSHSEFNFEGNIITISASGAYSGFVWYHDYPIFASDCIVLQSKSEKEVSTHFIYYVMKALQQEIYKLQQGSGQPHVYVRDIEKFIIPTPSPTKQTEMLKHIKDIHNQIKKLQSDAAKVLETAKQEVERMILGI